MMRTIVLTGAILLLGVIANIAVAWSAACWGSRMHVFGKEPGVTPEHVEQWWTRNSPEEVQEMYDSRISRWEGFAMDGFVATTQWRAELDYIHTIGHAQRWGWPMRSMSADSWVLFGPTGHRSISNGWQLAGNKVVPRVLPLHPMWPGFAINTAMSAAILWLLFIGPFVARRAFRRKRGQCLACGYPIATSAVCTECGQPVTPRRVPRMNTDTKDQG